MTDPSSVWAFFQKHKHRLGSVAIGLILFLAGWQVGRVTSPYYAAHPIVFEDRDCPGCPDSGGETAALQELQQQGVAQREGAGSAVAGAQTSASPEPAVVISPTPADRGEVVKLFVGSVNSSIFHDPTCSAAKRIKETNQVWFASVEEAMAAGYTPSQCTAEKLNLPTR